MITITESAQEYLSELLRRQKVEGMAVRVFILDAGTPKAETCLSFCRPRENQETDEMRVYKDFNVYLEYSSLSYLKDTVVDYSKNAMGGQLTIKAPNSRLSQIQDDSPIEDWLARRGIM